MKQLSFARVTIAMAATALSLTSVYAQSDARIVRIPDAPSASTPPSGTVTPAPPVGLTPIFSSLGEVYAAYDTRLAWGVTGSRGDEESIGMPFTPAADATIYVIDAALGYFKGTNKASYAIYSDAAGLPGTAIQSFTVSDLPPVQTACCTTRVVVSTSGVPVKAGTRYWLVLSAAPSAEDFNGAWYWNILLAPGNTAYNLGSGWVSYNGAIAAFGVYGILASQ